MTIKELNSWTPEQVGFQLKRELYAGNVERMTRADAEDMMKNDLALSPEQREAQKKQETDDARRMGIDARIMTRSLKDFAITPSTSESTDGGKGWEVLEKAGEWRTQYEKSLKPQK